jgi:hypothetical protein
MDSRGTEFPDWSNALWLTGTYDFLHHPVRLFCLFLSLALIGFVPPCDQVNVIFVHITIIHGVVFLLGVQGGLHNACVLNMSWLSQKMLVVPFKETPIDLSLIRYTISN